MPNSKTMGFFSLNVVFIECYMCIHSVKCSLKLAMIINSNLLPGTQDFESISLPLSL